RDRLAACVLFLGRDPAKMEEDVAVLSDWLTRPPPPYFQLAVIERLRGMRTPGVSRSLLANWPSFSPSVRPQLIGGRASREEWPPDFLRGVENGVPSVHEIPPAVRQQLLKHKSSAMQRLAANLFQANTARTEVLAKYETVAAITGRAENGAAV